MTDTEWNWCPEHRKHEEWNYDGCGRAYCAQPGCGYEAIPSDTVAAIRREALGEAADQLMSAVPGSGLPNGHTRGNVAAWLRSLAKEGE